MFDFVAHSALDRILGKFQFFPPSVFFSRNLQFVDDNFQRTRDKSHLGSSLILIERINVNYICEYLYRIFREAFSLCKIFQTSESLRFVYFKCTIRFMESQTKILITY